MKLSLQYPPTPEFASAHAEIAITAVQKLDGLTLDFSPASLGVIDRIIQQFRNEGLTTSDIAETLFAFGCYSGDVFVCNLDAVWLEPSDALPDDVAGKFPFMVVKMPNGRVWSPITKAFSVFKNGPSESLEYLFQISVKP
jgi:hypothetical protein